MPELPEVETVMRGLSPVMIGQKIARADINRGDLRWPLPVNMAEGLTGARILQLRRRSKYILADLSTAQTLIIHLGMSGRFVISGVQIGGFHHEHKAPKAHDHIVLHMANGARVTFNDPRRFGHMDLTPTDQLDRHPLLVSLGPEPLGNAFDGPYLIARLKNRRSPIKSALLDQRIVAGLGNIYVCEVLHRAAISPIRQSGNISARRVEKIVPIVRDVLHEAIEAGGSSLRDFRQTDGALGYFQHRFRVYAQEGQPCPRTDCSGTVKRIVQSGRSSFYCAKCQR